MRFRKCLDSRIYRNIDKHSVRVFHTGGLISLEHKFEAEVGRQCRTSEKFRNIDIEH